VNRSIPFYNKRLQDRFRRIIPLSITLSLCIFTVAILYTTKIRDASNVIQGRKTNLNTINNLQINTNADEAPVRFIQCHFKSNSAESVSLKDVIQITLRHDLSPLSSAAFLELVNAKYYDGVFIFRVLKGFIAQWGFRPENFVSIKPKRRNEIADPVIVGKSLSNTRGTLSFAGGSTVQVFINVGDNSRLDKEGSLPFATVSTKSMVVVDKLYTGHKDGEGQIATIKEGKDAVIKNFPNMSQIEKCRAVPAFSPI